MGEGLDWDVVAQHDTVPSSRESSSRSPYRLIQIYAAPSNGSHVMVYLLGPAHSSASRRPQVPSMPLPTATASYVHIAPSNYQLSYLTFITSCLG